MGSTTKLALFDLDNTLVDRTACYRAWAERYCAVTGLEADAVEWFCEADKDGFAEREGLWGQARSKFGLAPPIDDLIATYRVQVLESYRPDPEVISALTRLTDSGYIVGIVTNGDQVVQNEKVRRAGLDNLAAAVCTSDEIGVFKPHRAIFEAAIGRCGVDPGQAAGSWMVGDAPGPDIGGAQALGLRTIWIRRGRTWNNEVAPPELAVDTIAQSVDAILADSSFTGRR